MSKRRRDLHKLTRRVERLENAHRRDLAKLKGEVIRAVRLVVDEHRKAVDAAWQNYPTTIKPGSSFKLVVPGDVDPVKGLDA